jgi:ADP-ribose pyrophosphatase YjhB (NUDIX family)
MAKEINIHPAQARILRELLFVREARFSSLNKLELSNDHFSFHIQQLLNDGLTEKTESGGYTLTIKGKEFANRMDTDLALIERQAKVGVAIACVRTIGKRKEYLIQKRLKQPYFGYHGFPTGKIRWGETIEETAKRELKEETGLISNNIEICGVKHKMDYDSNGNFLEDKFMFRVRINEPQGKLKTNIEGGKNMWLTKKEIKKLDPLFDGFFEVLESVDKKQQGVIERKYTVKHY